jgi:hypothetical protein
MDRGYYLGSVAVTALRGGCRLQGSKRRSFLQAATAAFPLAALAQLSPPQTTAAVHPVASGKNLARAWYF